MESEYDFQMSRRTHLDADWQSAIKTDARDSRGLHAIQYRLRQYDQHALRQLQNLQSSAQVRLLIIRVAGALLQAEEWLMVRAFPSHLDQQLKVDRHPKEWRLMLCVQRGLAE